MAEGPGSEAIHSQNPPLQLEYLPLTGSWASWGARLAYLQLHWGSIGENRGIEEDVEGKKA